MSDQTTDAARALCSFMGGVGDEYGNPTGEPCTDICAECREAASRIAAALIAAGWTPPEPWQPIETAPRDDADFECPDRCADQVPPGKYYSCSTCGAEYLPDDNGALLPTPPKEAGQ